MNNSAIILATSSEKIRNSDKPAALCEILMQPVLSGVVSSIKSAGIEDICIISDCNAVEKYAADNNLPLFASTEDAQSFISRHNNENILVISGSLPFADADTISSAMLYHKTNGNKATAIAVGGKTPDGKYAHIFTKDEFSLYTSSAEYDIFNADNERFFVSPVTYKDLNKTNETLRIEMLENYMDSGVDIPCTDGIIIAPGCVIGADTKILPNTVIYGNVTIGKNCIIGPNSYIFNAQLGNGVSFNNAQIRNAKIMNNADIGPFAQIRPDAVIGDNVHLGNFTEVKNSVIDTGTKVSHLTYVGDADVGKDVNFGCGVVTVNFTGKTKHRTIIKDNAFIGCNTNLVAPVTVGENSYTAAGSTITQDVPDNSLSIARERQTNKEGWVKEKQPYRKKV